VQSGADLHKVLRHVKHHISLQPRGPIQRELSELVHFGRHCGGKEHRLPALWAHLHELLNFLCEAQFKKPIRFIQNQDFHIFHMHTVGVAQVIEHSPGGTDYNIWLLAELIFLSFHAHSTNDTCR
jgi:hypothetical protein